tara:strand:- start:260 stop:1333 length:1074 start_codon:yes stop_codon:yes gene_type:complete
MTTENLPPIIYQGSVKNIRHDNEDPYILFEFSDRYSIYDWGEMPDHIQAKGKNLCLFTDLIYSFLEKTESWKTWQPSEAVNENILEELKDQALTTHRKPKESCFENLWKVERIYVPQIVDQDYSFYKKQPQTTLLPLEVIFRFGVPKGSSLLRRAQKNPDYLASIGVESDIKEGSLLENLLIEYSTKLEPMDRYLSFAEAQEIGGCNDSEFQRLGDLTKIIALRLRDFFHSMDLSLWDGKLEFAFLKGVQNRKFMLVDTIAPDELRLMYRDMPLSKEVLRQAYWDSAWYKEIDKYKKEFGSEWKAKMLAAGIQPPHLKPEQKKWTEDMYAYLVQALQQPTSARKLFEDLYLRYKKEF